jgi:hypothetical protein
MPELSRSFQNVSLKTLSSTVFCASLVEGLNSGTASRTFSTPSPVPVLIQSWPKSAGTKARHIRRANRSLRHCDPKKAGLALSTIGCLEKTSGKCPRHDNIVIRYLLLGKISFFAGLITKVETPPMHCALFLCPRQNRECTLIYRSGSPLIVKPELYRDLTARILRRKRAECINALNRT